MADPRYLTQPMTPDIEAKFSQCAARMEVIISNLNGLCEDAYYISRCLKHGKYNCYKLPDKTYLDNIKKLDYFLYRYAAMSYFMPISQYANDGPDALNSNLPSCVSPRPQEPLAEQRNPMETPISFFYN